MTDAEILALYRRRDERAIEETQQKYGAYCYKIAAQILRDREDCEECINEALSRVWEAIPPQSPESLKLYVAAAARNAAFSRYRSQSSQKRGGTEVTLALDELSDCVPARDTPEDAVLAKELSGAVNRFLGTLCQRDRGVFLRRYFFTESTAEIAGRYGLRESNVLMILSRTRKKLKTYLKQEGYL